MHPGQSALVPSPAKWIGPAGWAAVASRKAVSTPGGLNVAYAPRV